MCHPRVLCVFCADVLWWRVVWWSYWRKERVGQAVRSRKMQAGTCIATHSTAGWWRDTVVRRGAQYTHWVPVIHICLCYAQFQQIMPLADLCSCHAENAEMCTNACYTLSLVNVKYDMHTVCTPIFHLENSSQCVAHSLVQRYTWYLRTPTFISLPLARPQ